MTHRNIHQIVNDIQEPFRPRLVINDNPVRRERPVALGEALAGVIGKLEATVAAREARMAREELAVVLPALAEAKVALLYSRSAETVQRFFHYYERFLALLGLSEAEKDYLLDLHRQRFPVAA